MTIECTTTSVGYRGDDENTVFEIPFPVPDKNVLGVSVSDRNGKPVPFLEGTDYRIKTKGRNEAADLVGWLREITVELTRPLATGYLLTIRRHMPLTQEIVFNNQGHNSPRVTEEALDKLTMIAQQLSGDLATLETNHAEQSTQTAERLSEMASAIAGLRERDERLSDEVNLAGARMNSAVRVLEARLHDMDRRIDKKMPAAPAGGLWVASGSGWIPFKNDNDEEETMLMPTHYQRSSRWSSTPTTLVPPQFVEVVVGGTPFLAETKPVYLSVAASWDSPEWTTPAKRAGKDFYVYAHGEKGSAALQFVLSHNATIPAGSRHTADNTRKVGGFHCLCADVGLIEDHPLSGMTAGDILPASVWDLRHRPLAGPEGMAYHGQTGKWYQIYLCDTDGLSTCAGTTARGNLGGEILGYPVGSQYWFAELLSRNSLSLVGDMEFQIVARGSNRKTSIAALTYSGTSGGHVDTDGRRMISEIGLEDCCGALDQWVTDNAATTNGSWAFQDATGGNGGVNGTGVGLVAGGHYVDETNSGPSSRLLDRQKWSSAVWWIGGRGCCFSKHDL